MGNEKEEEFLRATEIIEYLKGVPSPELVYWKHFIEGILSERNLYKLDW